MNVVGLYFLDCKMGIIILINSYSGKCLESVPEPGTAPFSPLSGSLLTASLWTPARPAFQPGHLLPQSTSGGLL